MNPRTIYSIKLMIAISLVLAIDSAIGLFACRIWINGALQ